MPYRTTPLVKGEIYHVFNRSIAKQPIFLDQRDYQRALETIKYYRFFSPSLRFSHYKRLTPDTKKAFLEDLIKGGKFSVEIFAYCIMPNHFHFLLKQTEGNSLSAFVRNFQNSYSKYFNTKRKRSGSLFQAMFKAVRIESEEQLVHVSRYIHLNPTSSFLIKTASLENYPWSSFSDYSPDRRTDLLTSTKLVLSHFSSKEKYREFVFDQVSYQRELQKIEHLLQD